MTQKTIGVWVIIDEIIKVFPQMNQMAAVILLIRRKIVVAVILLSRKKGIGDQDERIFPGMKKIIFIVIKKEIIIALDRCATRAK